MDVSEFPRQTRERDGRGLQRIIRVLMFFCGCCCMATCVGKRSSRQIEKATYDDVAFRYLSANQQPDHAIHFGFRKSISWP